MKSPVSSLFLSMMILLLVPYLPISMSTMEASTIVFDEDFEGSFPGSNWLVGDWNPSGGEDYWDDTGHRSHGGSMSGWCSDVGDTAPSHVYDNNMYAYMVRKYTMDASGWESVSLSFYAWYKTEGCCDYCRVIVSNDGGGMWDEITDPTLKGDHEYWTKFSVSIPSTYLTSQFSVGFVFKSDGSQMYEGVYIDDIILQRGDEVSDPYFYDADLEDYVDVDGDGYYRSVTVEWDADVDADVYVDVYVEAEGRDSDGIQHFLEDYGIYTIYDNEIDYKDMDVEVPHRDVWDIRLELYKWDGLPDLVDDWWFYDVPMEPADEDVVVTVDASITYFDVEEGTFHPDDIVQAEAVISNTGDSTYTFKIDYAIRDAAGHYWPVYKHDREIAKGASLTLDDELDWTVPPDVAEGDCDGRLLVLDPDTSETYDSQWDHEGPSIELLPQPYFYDVDLEDYVDVDGDGYYRSVTVEWDADVDADVDVEVYVEAERRDSSGIESYANSFGPYTIHGDESDRKSFTVEVPYADEWDIRLELYKWDSVEITDEWWFYDITMERADEDESSEPINLDIASLEAPSEVVINENFSLDVDVEYSLSSSTDIRIQVYEHAGPLLNWTDDTLSGSGSQTYPFTLTAPSTPDPDWQLNVHLFYWDGDEWIQSDIESAHIEVREGIPPDFTVLEPEKNDLVVAVNCVVFPGTPGTHIERIHWDWGDGYEEDQWFPACHTFADYGDYTITVTACQSDDLSATVVKQASLSPPEVGPTILILANEDIYVDIRANLSIFEEDLHNEGYEILKRTVTGETSPPEIKDIIKSCYLQYDLVGAILVGNIRAAYAEIKTGWGSGPTHEIWISLDASDMYYMDLDGQWESVANPDFCEDAPSFVEGCHTYASCEAFRNEYVVYLDEEKEWDYSAIEDKEQYKAEIWVSRIMAHNLDIPDKNEAQIINEFLDWNHRYRTDGHSISDKAYILNAIGSGYNEQGMDYSKIFDTIVKKEKVTENEYVACLEDPTGSELLYLTAHSWPQGHALYDKSLTADELLDSEKNSVFYILNTCSACRWDQSITSPENPNYLGGLYVFGKTHENADYGLGAIGFTGVGGFNWLEYFTDYLNENPSGTYGEAYKYWFNKNLMHIFGPTNYLYLGDPTIGESAPAEHPLVKIRGIVTNEHPYEGFDISVEEVLEGELETGITIFVGLFDLSWWEEETIDVGDYVEVYGELVEEEEPYTDWIMVDPDKDHYIIESPDLTVFDPEFDELTVCVKGVVLGATRLHWDWGDEYEEDHWFAACHTYDNYGTYTITVTAYSSEGLTSTETKTIRTLTIRSSSHGYTIPSAGDYFCNENDDIAVMAYPDGDYQFAYWILDEEGDGVDIGDDNPVEIYMDHGHTLKPVFEKLVEDPPTAYIDSISPNPALEGETVHFEGHGTDPDGYITEYRWESSIDGFLSDQSSFSTNSLSLGTHTISFKVKDDDGEWSEPDTETLTIEGENIPPTAYIDSITPNPAEEGESVSLSGHGYDPDGYIAEYQWESSIDGFLSDQSSFSASELSVGTHTIYFKVEDNDDLWSDPKTETLEITTKVATDYWAIIVCGSRDSELSFDENVKFMYRLLTRNFDYDDDHIFYVSPFEESGVDRKWTLKGDDDVMWAIDQVADRSDSNDVVFLYYTAHGKEDVLDAGLFDIDASELDTKLDSVTCEAMVIVLQGCHSGSFIDNLDDETNRVVLTSTDTTHKSYARPGKASYFTGGFLDSFTKKDDGNLVADTSEPYGKISSSESFVYAKENDKKYIQKKEFPQMKSTGPDPNLVFIYE